MNYEYESEVSIIMGGCAAAEIEITYDPQFDAGETAYNKAKAFVGIFQKHTVKRVRTSGFDVIGYIDTFNQLHNEGDLVTLEVAQEIVATALEVQARERKERARTCYDAE